MAEFDLVIRGGTVVTAADSSRCDVGITDGRVAALSASLDGGRDPTLAANWLTGAYFAALNRSDVALAEAPVDADKLGGLLDLIAEETISGRIAKEVFEAMWASGKSAAAIVEEKGLRQISDQGAVEAIVERVIADNPKQVEQFKSGNEKLIGWFVGQVMKASQGKANPALVNRILKQKLS